jgi:hypothetical protein
MSQAQVEMMYEALREVRSDAGEFIEETLDMGPDELNKLSTDALVALAVRVEEVRIASYVAGNFAAAASVGPEPEGGGTEASASDLSDLADFLARATWTPGQGIDGLGDDQDGPDAGPETPDLSEADGIALDALMLTVQGLAKQFDDLKAQLGEQGLAKQVEKK